MKKYGGMSAHDPVYIGIDQSFTGFAITALTADGPYYTTVYKSPLRGVDRLLDLQSHMRQELHGFRILDVAIEGYAFGSQMSNMLGELGGMVKMTLKDDFDIYPVVVPPTSLKKYVTGKGNTQKNQMLMHVFKKWGLEFNDDNAADSYALAHLVSGKAELKHEKEVYDKLQDPEYRER